MPLNQRRVIAEAIEGKRYVEWGCGGTTTWLLANASPAAAVTIEHNESWAKAFRQSYVWQTRIGIECKNWTLKECPCTTGANATTGEECSPDGEQYVRSAPCRIDGKLVEVYLIDGVLRSRCLYMLIAGNRPMTIFLHDTQRDWYDDAIAEAIDAGFERTDYPEGEDYPGCLLTKLEKQR